MTGQAQVAGRRGSLRPPSDAPDSGEMVDVVASGHGWRIEQILTGQMEQPIEDLLDHEEWVTVLAGAATLEIAGRTEFVETGDWLRLGPGVPHRVLSAEPGTSWLAVHIGPPESAPAG